MGITAPALATFVGLLGAVLGIWMTGLRQRARAVVPFSAGILLGVALFGLVPELASEIGWAITILLFSAGYGVLLLVNRFAYPVCPDVLARPRPQCLCHGTARLRGAVDPGCDSAQFPGRLERRDGAVGGAAGTARGGAAGGGAAQTAGRDRAGRDSAGGGEIARGGVGVGVLAEGSTLAGGALGLLMGPRLGSEWITYPMGIAAGWLFYLGYHAVHEEWKRRGARPAFASAAAGVAGAAAIQRGVEAWFR